MIFDKLIDSGILTLTVVLLSIIAIIFLVLKYHKNDGNGKIHVYYISGLLVLLIVELVTYICVNDENSTQIVNYISFASTISSLFLSVVAIIYAIVSNNKGEAQYAKIDKASDRITTSVDKFSSMSTDLTSNINSILIKLDEIKTISDETRKTVSQNNQLHTGHNSRIDPSIVGKIIDGYIKGGSFYGNLGLLSCVYSKDKNRPFNLLEILPGFTDYLYGYLIASSALGVVTTQIINNQVSVIAYEPSLKQKLIDNIHEFIKKSDPAYKEANKNSYELINSLFGIRDSEI